LNKSKKKKKGKKKRSNKKEEEPYGRDIEFTSGNASQTLKEGPCRTDAKKTLIPQVPGDQAVRKKGVKGTQV